MQIFCLKLVNYKSSIRLQSIGNYLPNVPILGFGGKSQLGNFLFARPIFASNKKLIFKMLNHSYSKMQVFQTLKREHPRGEKGFKSLKILMLAKVE